MKISLWHGEVTSLLRRGKVCNQDRPRKLEILATAKTAHTFAKERYGNTHGVGLCDSFQER